MVRLGVVALIVLSSFQLGAFADDAPGGGPSLRGGQRQKTKTQPTAHPIMWEKKRKYHCSIEEEIACRHTIS
eukprot:3306144-Amphidinium_carterae.1